MAAPFRKHHEDDSVVHYTSATHPERNTTFPVWMYNGMEETFKFGISLEDFKKKLLESRNGAFWELKNHWINDFFNYRTARETEYRMNSRSLRGQSRQPERALSPVRIGRIPDLEEHEEDRDGDQSFDADQPSTSGIVYPNQLMGTVDDDGFRVPHPQQRGARRAAKPKDRARTHAVYVDVMNELDSDSSANPSREHTPFGVDAASMYQKTMLQRRKGGSGPRANSVLADLPISDEPDFRGLERRYFDSDGSLISKDLMSFRVKNFEKFYGKLTRDFRDPNVPRLDWNNALIYGDSDSLKNWLKKIGIASKDIREFLRARPQGDRASRRDWEAAQPSATQQDSRSSRSRTRDSVNTDTTPSSSSSPAMPPLSRAGSSAGEPIDDDMDIIHVPSRHGSQSRRSNGSRAPSEHGASGRPSRAASAVSAQSASRRGSPEDPSNPNRPDSPIFGALTQSGRTPGPSRAPSVMSSDGNLQNEQGSERPTTEDPRSVRSNRRGSPTLQNGRCNGFRAPSENGASGRSNRAAPSVRAQNTSRRGSPEDPSSPTRPDSRIFGALTQSGRTPTPSPAPVPEETNSRRQRGSVSRARERLNSIRSTSRGRSVGVQEDGRQTRRSTSRAASVVGGRDVEDVGRAARESRADSVISTKGRTLFLNRMVEDRDSFIRSEYNLMYEAEDEEEQSRAPSVRSWTPSLVLPVEPILFDDDAEDQDGRESHSSGRSSDILSSREVTPERRAPSVEWTGDMPAMEENRPDEQVGRRTGNTPQRSRASSVMSNSSPNQTVRPTTRRSIARSSSRQVTPVAQNGHVNGNGAHEPVENGNQMATPISRRSTRTASRQVSPVVRNGHINGNGAAPSTTPRRSPSVQSSGEGPSTGAPPTTPSLKRTRAASPTAPTSSTPSSVLRPATNEHAGPQPKTAKPSTSMDTSTNHEAQEISEELLRSNRAGLDRMFEDFLKSRKLSKFEEYVALGADCAFWAKFCESEQTKVIESSAESLFDELRTTFPDEDVSKIKEILAARENLEMELKEEVANEKRYLRNYRTHLEAAFCKHFGDYKMFTKATLDLNIPTFIVKQYFLSSENRSRVLGKK